MRFIVLVLQIKEHEKKTLLGTLNLQLSRLLHISNMALDQRFPLERSGANSQIKLKVTLRVRVCTHEMLTLKREKVQNNVFFSYFIVLHPTIGACSGKASTKGDPQASSSTSRSAADQPRGPASQNPSPRCHVHAHAARLQPQPCCSLRRDALPEWLVRTVPGVLPGLHAGH